MLVLQVCIQLWWLRQSPEEVVPLPWSNAVSLSLDIMKEPNEAEIRRATAHAAMYFIISLLLAFFAVYIPITLSIGLRVLFVTYAHSSRLAIFFCATKEFWFL